MGKIVEPKIVLETTEEEVEPKSSLKIIGKQEKKLGCSRKPRKRKGKALLLSYKMNRNERYFLAKFRAKNLP